MKKTSNINRRLLIMEDNLKILKVQYLSNHWLDLPQTLNLRSGDKIKNKHAWNEEDLQYKKTTSHNGRQPRYIKTWISQQPLIGSSSNLKHKLMGPNQIKKNEMKTTFNNGRGSQNIRSEIYQQVLVGSLLNSRD